MVRNAFRWAQGGRPANDGLLHLWHAERDRRDDGEDDQFALELDPDLANFMLATPYPGTEMYDVIQKNGNVFANEWARLRHPTDKAHFTMTRL